ncbi:MAG: BA14K family protein [Proteobacteria bacterium]|nr:MAG: BA14K family protein [Pseudomonadota bacterium]
MIYSKILGTAAAMALILPLLATAPAYAQAGGGGAIRGGGGGGGGAVMGGGGGRSFGGSPSFGGARSFSGARTSSGRTFAVRPGGGNWAGRPGWSGSRPGWGHRPGRHHYHRHGFYPGFIGGAIIGSSLAWPYYSDPYYYDDVVVAPGGPSADEVAYCSSRFKSYDPRTGTYLGYDGLRHPCP